MIRTTPITSNKQNNLENYLKEEDMKKTGTRLFSPDSIPSKKTEQARKSRLHHDF